MAMVVASSESATRAIRMSDLIGIAGHRFWVIGPDANRRQGASHKSALPRRVSPGSCNFVVPPSSRGRRESRAPTAPVDPVRRSTRAARVPKHTGSDYRYSRDIPAFPTQWLYGLYVLSPVSGADCHR